MRKKLLILLAVLVVSLTGAAACGQAIEDRAREEVDRQVEEGRQRVEEEVEKGRERIEEEVTTALDQAEEEVRNAGGQDGGEGR